MDYCPNNKNDIESMLSVIGVKSVSDLFSAIPSHLRAKSFNLPAGLAESEVLESFKQKALLNDTASICFAGGGVYDHLIPSVVDALSSRAEFYTAYTPYQPECSQGTLQALFEYQTAICNMTGMEVSNASLYDGGTAVAEAVLMALRITDRKRVLLDQSIHPHTRQIVKTYLANLEVECIEIALHQDGFSVEALKHSLNENTACFVFQNPNFFGSIVDYRETVERIQQVGALAIESVYPASMGLISSSGEIGVDIAVGDGQSLGNPMNIGGPSFGFIATKKAYIRNLPGRIVGETVDKNGKRAFVLTLQAREQHIKRHKATSNICSNQSLCALRSVIFLSSLGLDGFVEWSRLNRQKAEYAKSILSKIKGVALKNTRPTFNEFVLTLPKDAETVFQALLSKKILGGIPLGQYFPEMKNELLIAVTEKRTKAEIDNLAKELEAILWRS